jgi:two-component system phosphate regulon response regulator PhoB
MVGFQLMRHGYTYRTAANAQEADELIRLSRPDLILLDWMMPGQNGIEFARKLRLNHYTKDIAIILLTAKDDESDMVMGLDAGADDYITKPFSPKELVARLKAVLRRMAPDKIEEIIEIAGLRLDPNTREATTASGPLHLGPTEFRLLRFFMTHRERVYSRQEILDHVWGDNILVEERTVDVHIRRLRKALTETGHHELIRTVRGAGYRFSERP